MTNLADRIMDSFPSGSYALSALLRLMDIVESDRVRWSTETRVKSPR